MRPRRRPTPSHALAPKRVVLARVALVALFTALLSGGCNANVAADPTSDLPCAVADVLARRCQTCHAGAPRFGAPMPLTTHAELTTTSKSDPARRVFESVALRTHDAARPMPPPPNARLGAADANVLDDWIAAGAPARSAAPTDATTPCGVTGAPPDAGATITCTPDLHVRPVSAFSLPSDEADLLVCYGWDSPNASKRHIIGLSPAIASAGQLHHVTLLQSDEPVSPVPAPCSPSAMTSWRALYGWAPGASGLELPSEVGLPLDPGGHFVVQMHYVNPTRQAAHDASGFDLCTTDQLRANDADVMAFGTTEITVPPRGALAVDCSVAVPEGGATTHLFAAFPHMHALGTSIATVVRAGGVGAPVDLGSVAHWDIGNQTWLPIDYVLRPGDVVQSKCSWSNPHDYGVGYGPTSDDEMCFSYVMYYPKIQASTWHWSLPALSSHCP